jgi:hypothetical protein
LKIAAINEADEAVRPDPTYARKGVNSEILENPRTANYADVKFLRDAENRAASIPMPTSPRESLRKPAKSHLRCGLQRSDQALPNGASRALGRIEEASVYYSRVASEYPFVSSRVMRPISSSCRPVPPVNEIAAEPGQPARGRLFDLRSLALCLGDFCRR